MVPLGSILTSGLMCCPPGYSLSTRMLSWAPALQRPQTSRHTQVHRHTHATHMHGQAYTCNRHTDTWTHGDTCNTHMHGQTYTCNRHTWIHGHMETHTQHTYPIRTDTHTINRCTDIQTHTIHTHSPTNILTNIHTQMHTDTYRHT